MDGYWTDVTVAYLNKEYKLHKFILARESDYFKSLFSERWYREGTTTLKLDNSRVTPDNMEALFAYFYTYNLDVHKHNVEGLLLASTFLRADKASNLVINWIAKSLDMETVGDYLFLLNSLELKPLEAVLIDYLCYIGDDILRSDVLQHIPFHTLCEVLSSDGLAVASEEDRILLAIRALIKWKSGKLVENDTTGEMVKAWGSQVEEVWDFLNGGGFIFTHMLEATLQIIIAKLQLSGLPKTHGLVSTLWVAPQERILLRNLTSNSHLPGLGDDVGQELNQLNVSRWGAKIVTRNEFTWVHSPYYVYWLNPCDFPPFRFAIGVVWNGHRWKRIFHEGYIGYIDVSLWVSKLDLENLGFVLNTRIWYGLEARVFYRGKDGKMQTKHFPLSFLNLALDISTSTMDTTKPIHISVMVKVGGRFSKSIA